MQIGCFTRAHVARNAYAGLKRRAFRFSKRKARYIFAQHFLRKNTATAESRFAKKLRPKNNTEKKKNG